MQCGGHTNGGGTVVCGSCGSAGCAACFEEVEDVFYCTDCLLRRLEAVGIEAGETERANEIHDIRSEAIRRIRRNRLLTTAGLIVIALGVIDQFATDPSMSAPGKLFAVPALTIALTYLLWAFLWGVPAAWNWWKDLFENSSWLILESSMGWLVLAVGFFVIPIYFGYLYGVFGGAVYEYRKAKNLELVS